MLAFLAKPLVGQIAGPLAALLLGMLLVSQCTLMAKEHDLKNAWLDRDKAIADYGRCAANRTELEGRIEAQNTQIEGLAAAGRALEAKAARDLAEARKATENAQRAGNRLLRPLAANDQCSRVIEADKRVLEDLR